MARLGFDGEQKDTSIDVEDDIVIDRGVGKVLAVGKHKKQFIDEGISSFGEWQMTSQIGPSPGDDTPKYRVHGIGPEI